ncbi:MAG: hypothetical protein LC685_02505, partial [Actinobacteria bacterium]|nr:hypothetical protein [Actinomycetota bacterium]
MTEHDPPAAGDVSGREEGADARRHSRARAWRWVSRDAGLPDARQLAAWLLDNAPATATLPDPARSYAPAGFEVR